MKRSIIFLTTAMALLTIEASAQTRQSTTFGLRGGVNFQNINGKDDDGNEMNNKVVTRYNAGINAEIPVGTNIFLQPGLLFTTKGARDEKKVLNQDMSADVHLSYVELPINLVFKPSLGQGNMLLGFGPYVAMGVGGKVDYEGNGTTQSKDIKFKKTVMLTDPDNVVYFSPMDAGVNMLAGYEFRNKFSFQLNAQLGMMNINPDYEGSVNDKSSSKNTGFGISLGYRFH